MTETDRVDLGVEEGIVWETVRNELSPLIETLESVLGERIQTEARPTDRGVEAEVKGIHVAGTFLLSNVQLPTQSRAGPVLTAEQMRSAPVRSYSRTDAMTPVSQRLKTIEISSSA